MHSSPLACELHKSHSDLIPSRKKDGMLRNFRWQKRHHVMLSRLGPQCEASDCRTA